MQAPGADGARQNDLRTWLPQGFKTAEASSNGYRVRRDSQAAICGNEAQVAGPTSQMPSLQDRGPGWPVVVNLIPTGIGWLAAMLLAFVLQRRKPPIA